MRDNRSCLLALPPLRGIWRICTIKREMSRQVSACSITKTSRERLGHQWADSSSRRTMDEDLDLKFAYIDVTRPYSVLITEEALLQHK